MIVSSPQVNTETQRQHGEFTEKSVRIHNSFFSVLPLCILRDSVLKNFKLGKNDCPPSLLIPLWIVQSIVIAGLFQQAISPAVAQENTTNQPTAEPASSDLATTIQQLVDRLGHDSRQERAAAEAELLSLPTDALHQLPAPASSMPPSVRETLTRVRNQLERRAAREAAQPTTVTLHGRHSLTDLARELSQQTKNLVSIAEEPGSQEASVDWEQIPFWTAMTDLEQMTGLEVSAAKTKDTLELVPSERTEDARATTTAGPCQVTVVSATIKSNFVDPSKSILHVRWKLQPEPRLRPFYVTVADADMTASLGDVAIRPFATESRKEIPVDRWSGCQIDTSFEIPRDLSATEMTFGGKAAFRIAALPLPIEFDRIDRGTPLVERRGGVNAVLRKIHFDEAAKSLSLRVSVSYDRGGPEFESHRMWIHQNAAWLVNRSDGTILKPGQVELAQMARSGGVLDLDFDGVENLTDDRFVYEAPTLVIDVPIEFSGLKVPIDVDGKEATEARQ